MARAGRLALAPLGSDLTAQAVQHWLSEMQSDELRHATIRQLAAPFNFKLVHFVKPAADDKHVHCTLCKKGDNQVKKMVQDQDTGIAMCNECIDLYARQIAEPEAAKPKRKARASTDIITA